MNDLHPTGERPRDDQLRVIRTLDDLVSHSYPLPMLEWHVMRGGVVVGIADTYEEYYLWRDHLHATERQARRDAVTGEVRLRSVLEIESAGAVTALWITADVPEEEIQPPVFPPEL